MNMTETEMKLIKHFINAENAIKEIQFICERAKRFYIEEKDIDDILKSIKDYNESIR